MRRLARCLLPFAFAITAIPTAIPAAAIPAAASTETEWREVFSPDGSISRERVPAAPQPPATAPEIKAEVVPIQQTGPSQRRFDLVFVGDGYTPDQLAGFHEHAVSKWEELAAVEPFKSYRDSFNVWQVNVVSRQSGVDHDPKRGVQRDTALDMGFWCQGTAPETQRLLCVNETKANQFADLAPAADQVIALGNSTTYGGAGGAVATSSGGNAQAGQIAIHELGHSIGGLADEYDYPNDTYTGEELPEPNVSIHTREEIEQGKLKWHRFLGQPTPDGGVIGAYEGARYYRYGIYRPSQNSIMRTLGREFNLPGKATMSKAIEAETAPGRSAHSTEVKRRESPTISKQPTVIAAPTRR